MKARNQKLFEQKLGVPHVSPGLRNLLVECMCDSTTRYAINRVFINKTTFAVSDGRRLLELKLENKFESGLYFLTKDGYCLLDKEAEKFPKYQDVFLKQEKEILEKSCLGIDIGATLNLVLYELHRADMFFNTEMLRTVIGLILKLNASLEDVRISVAANTPAEKPFVIRGDLKYFDGTVPKTGSLTYIQMPMKK